MIKFKVNLTGLQKKIVQLERILETKELKKQMGEASIIYIQGKTRTGKDVLNNTVQPALKKTTVKRREYLEPYNDRHKTYSKARSNLTFTGQLLDSLKWESMKGGFKVLVPATQREPYKGKKGTYKTTKKPVTNARVARGLKAQGREFLGVDKSLTKQIQSIVRNFIRRSFRR